MRIILLGSENKESEKLLGFLRSSGEEVTFVTEKLAPETVRAIEPDIIVSYNYRFILKRDILDIPKRGAINLHISYLPWNRGADPNFWSHVEGTPSGVTIHYIDEGVDTGEIIAQKRVEFESGDTLRTSYEKLHTEIQHLFEAMWPSIKTGTALRIPQQGNGTSHLKKDKERLASLTQEKGYDTPISLLMQNKRQ